MVALIFLGLLLIQVHPLALFCMSYFSSCVTEKYMVTESYAKIVHNLNSNSKKVLLLKGLKGAGKMNALLYLTHYYTTKDWTTFPKVVLASSSWQKIEIKIL